MTCWFGAVVTVLSVVVNAVKEQLEFGGQFHQPAGRGILPSAPAVLLIKFGNMVRMNFAAVSMSLTASPLDSIANFC